MPSVATQLQTVGAVRAAFMEARFHACRSLTPNVPGNDIWRQVGLRSDESDDRPMQARSEAWGCRDSAGSAGSVNGGAEEAQAEHRRSEGDRLGGQGDDA